MHQKKKGYILKWGDFPHPTPAPATADDKKATNDFLNLPPDEKAQIIATSLGFLGWLSAKHEANFKILFMLYQIETGITSDENRK